MEKDKQETERRQNPYVDSNIFSLVSFGWTGDIFENGKRRNLEFSDLYEVLPEHSSARLMDDFSKAWDEEVKKERPSLAKVIFRCYGRQIMMILLVGVFLECFLKLLQPILIGRFVLYFMPGESSQMSIYDLDGYAIGIILCSTLILFIYPMAALWTMHLCMKYRIGCSALVYRKALKLSKRAMTETSIGQIVNLLSNDVGRFDYATVLMNFLILAPFQAIIISIFLWMEIGAAAFVGIFVLFSLIPLQIWLGLLIRKEKCKAASLTDKRLRLINEIISGIKVIKALTWERAFAKLLKLARLDEINKLRHISYIRGIVLSFGIYNTRFAMLCSFLVYVMTGNVLTAKNVFVVTTFYGYIKQSLCVLFPQAITMMSEIRVTLSRLETFLLYEESEAVNYYKSITLSEVETGSHIEERNETEVPFIGENAIKNIKVKWNQTIQLDEYDDGDELSDSENEKLENSPLNLNYDRQDVAVLTDKLYMTWDTHRSNWILSNISFSVKTGSLVAVVGEVGCGKSSLFLTLLKEAPVAKGSFKINGQVSYASQDPWIFNSSLRQNILFGSEMKSDRYGEVVSSCGLMEDFKSFVESDRKLAGEQGAALSGGQKTRVNLARALYREADIYFLDDPFSAVDVKIRNQIFDESILKFLKGKTRILITNHYEYLDRVDHIIMISDGYIAAEGTYNELLENPKFKALLINGNKNNDVNEEEILQDIAKNKPLDSGKMKDEAYKMKEEIQKSGSVDSSIYKAYILATGPWILLIILTLALILTQILSSASDFWIAKWVNDEERFTLKCYNNETNSTENILFANEDSFDRNSYLAIYGGLVGSLVILTIARALMFFCMCLRASVKLHKGMFKSIIYASMRFFYSTPSGRIMNRFSKDIGIIDDTIPMVMIDIIQIALQFAGILILVILINNWFTILVLLLIGTFISLREKYINIARSLKRLEGIARSPIFSHVTATLQGLATIRVFQVQNTLTEEFESHQNRHSSVWFMILGTTRAFGLWLDAASVFFLSALVIICTLFKGYFTSSDVGLAITQVLALISMIQWGIRQSTELESLMTSVERVMEYHDVEQEPCSFTKKISHVWLKRGRIVFDNVGFRYFPKGRKTLRNVSFVVDPKEKIGIVGRSGSGKSSIVNAILRMGYTDGSIIIDDHNIETIELDLLRKNISIIPQEPMLFSGTLRFNLDPHSESDDDSIWDALERVEMKETISEIEDGLNSTVTEGGGNFSVGQKQLICLARAIVRRNHLVILDEATANVDPRTDSLIQKAIREEFQDCTVIMISHRLHTVIDSDKILVVENGQVTECDHPHILLQKKDGRLYNMLKNLKNDTSSLFEMAEKSYKQKNSATL